MESANLSHQHHHHQHQEQFGGSSSIATLPSLHIGAAHDSTHLWNQNLSQNGAGNYSSNGVSGGVFSTSSRDNLLRQSEESSRVVAPSLNISMFQDLAASHWGGSSSCADNYSSHSTPHEVFHGLCSKVIKAELSETSCFPKYGINIINPSNQLHHEEMPLPSTSSYIKHEQQYHLQDLNEKLLLRSFSSNGFQTSTEAALFHDQPSSRSYSSTNTVGALSTPSTRGSFSRIHPSATISAPNLSSSSSSSSTSSSSSLPFMGSLGLNLQAMDLLASAKQFGGSLTQPSMNNLGLLRETVPFGFENIRSESNQESSNCSSQKISFVHGGAESKRPSALSDSKASQSSGTAQKKPRFESRSSFPPFKVRKEKLGDRIAALQQLVAPFGKTDTASVLMEAIGYIKFLQDQVETLSVPYMKSSGKTKRGSSLQGGGGDEEGEEEPKRDLRSRGLCLVPLSCTSYVTNDTGSVWSPPNFTGGN